jgi:geranylgeranyl pyrophosphate synthase
MPESPDTPEQPAHQAAHETGKDHRDIKQALQDFAAGFDPQFRELLTLPADAVPPALVEAMQYSALAPGKRLRPFLVVQCARMCSLDEKQAASIAAGDLPKPVLHAAAAIEAVHAFSLIHDDLPAMDDDDLRRGRPTCHKQFGEAMAILAGDALLTRAFELLSDQDIPPDIAALLVVELATGTGWAGMIGGQVLDIQSEGKPPDLELVRRIHACKTARLLECACGLGALSVRASGKPFGAVRWFGHHLGLAFQIVDDLLDETAESEQLGKTVGKDRAAGKQTYPACVGMEESRQAVAEHTQAAKDALQSFGQRADFLLRLADYAVDRNY